MFIFELTPFSGHISRVAAKALKIAQAFPEDSFRLKFNDISINISPTSDTVESIIEHYDAIREDRRCELNLF